MKGTSVCIVDEEGRVIPNTEKGELCLMGDQVASRYWADRQRTEESFVELRIDGEQRRAYKTGDICYENRDGDFIYCGRSDSQVKVDGYRIELAEIEYHLKKCTGLQNVACVVRSEKSGATTVIQAFLESAEPLDAKELLIRQLPAYMIPKEFIYLPKLPLNMNGKIDRSKLREWV